PGRRDQGTASTAPRPPVFSADDLLVRCAPRNQRASPSLCCSAIGAAEVVWLMNPPLVFAKRDAVLFEHAREIDQAPAQPRRAVGAGICADFAGLRGPRSDRTKAPHLRDATQRVPHRRGIPPPSALRSRDAVAIQPVGEGGIALPRSPLALEPVDDLPRHRGRPAELDACDFFTASASLVRCVISPRAN